MSYILGFEKECLNYITSSFMFPMYRDPVFDRTMDYDCIHSNHLAHSIAQLC